ncbi:MAG: Gfo/Idh/MocA family oxidoreductase [Bacteroidota bacterium]
MPQFKWGILGLGKIAHKFAEDLTTIDGAKLWAVGSRSEERAKLFAQQYGAVSFFGTYAGLIASGQVDAVYISTPHTSHLELTIACLEAGIPVLCEKPMGMNASQVQTMIEAARESNTYLMEALWTRFLPSTKKVLTLIESGQIGTIEGLRADFGFKAGPKSSQRITDKSLGAGSLLDIGIYPVFLAQLLFGPPVEIQAMARLDENGIDVDCSLNFRYPGRQIAQLYATLLARTKTEATIHGSEALIHWHPRWHEPSNFSIIKAFDQPPVNHFFDYDCAGYAYEAKAVMEDVRAGRLENELWSWADSLQLHETLTEVRKVIGLSYPADLETSQ